jgi:ABC-type branched-subunit amino acid transport system substrate-binding protein
MNLRMRQAIVATLLCLIAATAAFAADIVVGQIVDYESLDHDMSRDFVAGAKVYFDHVNSQGGVNGRRIVHLVRDGEGDPRKSVALARELIEKDRADVLFGFVGEGLVSATLKSAEFKGSRLALLAPVSGAATAGPADRLFYTRATYAAEARKAVEQFRRQGLERFALLYVDTDYGRAVRQAIHDELRAGRLALSLERPLRPDGQGAAAEARALGQLRPQVVIVVADALALAEVIKTYRPLDPGSLVVGLSMVNHETLLQIAGPVLARGTLLTQVVPDPLKTNSTVLREHIELMKRYRDEPPSHLTLEGFIAAKVLVQAIRGAGRDLSPAGITTALRAMPRVDLDESYVTWLAAYKRDANFVDVTFLRGDGTLLH